jgi:hypothetical protein
VYKELLGMRKQGDQRRRHPGVIEQSWLKRRRTAADVFLMITGREASEHATIWFPTNGGHCGQGERHAAGAAEP